MSCNLKRKFIPQNKSYMSSDDDVMFHKWFADAWTERYPDSPILDSQIKNVTIVVNQTCNFACTYCYEHQKTEIHMSHDLIKPTVNFILDDSMLNGYVDSVLSPCVILDFIGGEPLLDIDLIDEFLEYFKYRALELNHPWAYNYMVSISSNGSLFNTPKVQAFIGRNPSKIGIGISIDGDKELHDSCRVYKNTGKGTYDDVVENVKVWAKMYNGEATTKVTLSPENLKYLPKSIQHLWNLDMQIVNANVVFEDVWNNQHARDYYLLLKELANNIIDKELYIKKYTSLFSEHIGAPMGGADNNNWCGGDGAMMAIGPDGVVYPCMRYMKFCMSNKERKPLIIGNITDGVGNLDSEKEVILGLHNITRRSQSNDKCYTCPVGQGCAWCSAFNYDCFGTPNKRTTFICEMHQARVLANAYFWNTLYMKLGLNEQFKLHLPEDWAVNIVSLEEYNMLKQISNREEIINE